MSESVSPPYLGVLRIIYEGLRHTTVDWVITGSLGFALQGVPVEPHDIDLQTDTAGAYEIERLLAPYVVQPVAFSEAARIRSHLGALRIEGVEVEIMGDIQHRRDDGTWDAPVDLRRYRQWVDTAGMQLPVLSLEYEYQAYLRMGRRERAEMLRRWMQAEGITES